MCVCHLTQYLDIHTHIIICLPCTYLYIIHIYVYVWISFFLPFSFPNSQWANLKSSLIKSWFGSGFLVLFSSKNHNALTLTFPLLLPLVSYFYFRWNTPLNPNASLIRITGKERQKTNVVQKRTNLESDCEDWQDLDFHPAQ